MKKVTARIIELGDKKEYVTTEDLPYIISDVLDNGAMDNPIKIKYYTLSLANGLKPTANICVEIRGKSYEENSVGNGQYDAFMKALWKIYRSLNMERPTLIDYIVTIPPGGKTDALVETVITWNFKDREFKTRAVDADQTEAAIKATSKMLSLKNYNKMNIKIALLSGDGIGPEIISQVVKVVEAIAGKFNHKIRYEEGLVGAIGIDKTGNPFPDETFELCKRSDAVLFGAIGDPKYDLDPKAFIRPEQGLLAMRKKLGLFANIRPVFTFPSLIEKSPLRPEIIDGVDFIVIRELTGGIYFGEPRGRSEDGNVAYDTCIYSREEIERILHLAFQYAEKRSGKLTAVDKANVLASSRLWRETAQELEKE
ncbi:3-isopropylmalate dehydrogenase [subsurface metagenome]